MEQALSADPPVLPFIGVDLEDEAVRARVLRKLSQLRGRKAVYVENDGTRTDFLAWVSEAAPDILARLFAAADGRFRAILYPRSMVWTADEAVRANEKALADSLKAALVALSAFDEEAAAKLTAAAYVALTPASSPRRLLDGLLHRFTHAYHSRA